MRAPISLIVIGKEARLRAEMRTSLAATGRVQIVAESSDYQRGAELVGQLQPHGAVIIVNGEEETSLELVRQISQEHPNTVIICAGAHCAGETIVRAYRAGAREFLMHPPEPGEVREVLERVEALLGEGGRKITGRVIAVYSGRGGSGTTTIAVNTAAVLAQQTRQETVLLDLNLQYGSAPIFLGVEPTYSITDVAHNEQRLDIQLLRSFLAKVTEQLYCLAAPLRPEEADDVFPAHVEAALGLLRTQFAHILVDLPHAWDPNTIAALDQADVILVVTLGDLVSLYNTKRALETFGRMGYGAEKIRLIVNRYVRDKEVPLEKIGDALSHAVDFTLSDDPRAALEAIATGRPIVWSASKSPLARQFGELARQVAAPGVLIASPEKKGSGLLSMLWGGSRR